MKESILNLRGISLLLLASLFAAVVSSCAGTSARTPVSDGQAEEALEEDLREVQDDIPALTEVLSEYFDYVGVAIDRRETREPYSELLNMHFNSITFENDMKPERIQGSPGNFTWNNSDALMEFAEDNDLRVWGHTLVWHSQTPDWFFQDADGNPLTDSPEHQELLLHRMEEHINAIADRYGDSIAAWDVVNEVIDDSQDDYMRRSRWYEILGPDFVAHAFRFAREAFPNAQLYINDYNTEIPSKREAYFSVVEGLLADGVPIDGVGHQLHVNMNIPVSWVNDTIRRFGQLDVRQTVTELDVRISRDDQEQLESAPEERLVLQGYYYRDLFEVFKRHADKLDGITVWGLYDSRSWLRYWPITRNHEAPLLFDDDLQAKHAYWGIVDPSRLPHQSQVTDAAAGTPEIDGEADLLWQMLSGDELLNGSVFQLGYDQDTLYILADVVDNTRDEDDMVEVFYNGQSYRFSRSGESDTEAAIQETDQGYRVEGAIPGGVTLEAGDEIELDVRITDESAGMQFSWSDQSHEQEQNPERWGFVTLLNEVRLVEIPYTDTTPEIDGQKDSVWEGAAVVTTTVTVTGDPEGAKGDFHLLWNEDGLWVLAEVTDPVLDQSHSDAWQQDSIEIFVNPDNTKAGAYSADDGQYRINYENHQSISGDLEVIGENLTSAASVTDTGYIVEAFVALHSMDPETGDFIGLELQVNDATDGGRTAVHTWHDPTGDSYINTSQWGAAMLVE